jgi:haloalkane dehalogenase
MNEISSEFPFTSRYVEVHGSRMHYIDEGDGDPILFLHGNPTSSYLWRNIIPHVTGLGRAIAPDLIGMGKSDKIDIDYRFLEHCRYIEGFIRALGLKNITLVIHDWGSALGFHYARQHEENIKGIAFMEGILAPVASWDDFPEDFQQLFKMFRTPDVGWDMIVNQNFFVEQILPGAVVRPLTEAEMNRYREPFADVDSRKPLWRWPNEIPIEGEPAEVVEVVRAYNSWLQLTHIPKLMFYGTPGALMTAPVVDWASQALKNISAVDLGQGIHFLQEDSPHVIGEELASWYRDL